MNRKYSILLLLVCVASGSSIVAQSLPGPGGVDLRFGSQVPPAVRSIYEKSLAYLLKNQARDGSFPSSYGSGPGIAAICSMALMSTGEDVNYGKYAEPLRKALRFILRQQDPRTGLFLQVGNSDQQGRMYEHGFVTLCLAEAYGVVDDRLLFEGVRAPSGGVRTLGRALELGVRCILTAQEQNPHKVWRYSPTAQDEDTSVTGTILMALLAARNAGLEVPDRSIQKAIEYFGQRTLPDGNVVYSQTYSRQTLAIVAISTLVHAISRNKDKTAYRQALGNLTENYESEPDRRQYYHRYYVAQALFQGDFKIWERWNERIIEKLETEQKPTGAIGPDCYTTGMSLLALALNYRFLPVYER